MLVTSDKGGSLRWILDRCTYEMTFKYKGINTRPNTDCICKELEILYNLSQDHRTNQLSPVSH